MEKLKPPIPALKSWIVIAEVLSYSGYEDQVLSLLRQLSVNTRCYLKSHHLKLLKTSLKIHRFAPVYDMPQYLKEEDIKIDSSRSIEVKGIELLYEEDYTAIIKAWNNH